MFCLEMIQNSRGLARCRGRRCPRWRRGDRNTVKADRYAIWFWARTTRSERGVRRPAAVSANWNHRIQSVQLAEKASFLSHAQIWKSSLWIEISRYRLAKIFSQDQWERSWNIQSGAAIHVTVENSSFTDVEQKSLLRQKQTNSQNKNGTSAT